MIGSVVPFCGWYHNTSSGFSAFPDYVFLISLVLTVGMLPHFIHESAAVPDTWCWQVLSLFPSN